MQELETATIGSPRTIVESAFNEGLRGDIVARRDYEIFARNHDACLTEEALHLSHKATAAQYIVDTLRSGEDQSCIVDGANPSQSAVDLQALGLPGLPEGDEWRRGDSQDVPVAVLLHRQHDITKAIELVAVHTYGGQKMTRSYFLENYKGAIDGLGDLSYLYAEWVLPADAAFVGWRSSRASLRDGGSIQTVQVANYRSDESQVLMVRPPLTQLERRMAREERAHHASRSSKIKRRLGALLLSGAAVFGPAATPHADHTERLTSAQQILAPVEEHATNSDRKTKDALRRSEEAFETFYAHDHARLEQLAKQYGYHGEWVKEGALRAVKTSVTRTELEQHFAAAVGDLPFRLELDAANVDLLAGAGTRQEALSAEDIASARQAAHDMLEMISLLDKDHLRQIGPLTFVLAKNIYTKGGAFNAGGYYLSKNRQGGQSIYIDIGDGGISTITHELTHAFDYVSDGTMSADIDRYNPAGFDYVGVGKYMGASTAMNGMDVVAQDYGRVNEAEDVATIGEGLMGTNPMISLTNDPLTAKMTAFMATMEVSSPGFTAAVLARTEALPAETVDTAWNHILQYKDQLGGSVLERGAVALALFGAFVASVRYRSGKRASVQP